MTYQNLKLDVENHVALLTINRPEALNALNTETLTEIHALLNEIELDDDIYVLVITGAGKAFVAGADITEMQSFAAEEARRFASLGHRVFTRLETLTKPTLAAVNGYALGGGCELALACDMRIASEKARFGQPEVGLGIIPGFGGTQRLARVVGMPKAKELILTGKYIKAEQAEKIGLVNQVVEPEALLQTTIKMAGQIADKAQLAVRYAKRVINQSFDVDRYTGNQLEIASFALCFATADQKEGMQAFCEKRQPQFKDR